ncbi:GDSL-type esterase/lipase family protein [Paenibacillus glufosinatiresistens]|uniref:GDSL-type esterase/lipase family protein n=1 Tax=Paenibacillus glufosinatiresistens TaxID=3070657 RepID=UPI00286DA04D|nr:GDSL-type esterase/lipase family protein [Paenibacillus sp. YX.27]
MKDSRWTWRSVGILSLAASLLLAIGFLYAVRDIVNPRGEELAAGTPQATAPPVEEEYRIVALGDSLAKGTGDRDGKGFARRTVDVLTDRGLKASLVANLGVNGLTTAGLQDRLKEEGVRYAVKKANVILVSIGGNDLFRGSGIADGGVIADDAGTAAGETQPKASAPAPAAQGELDPKALLGALPAAAERMRSALDTLIELNPQASIYLVGLYNPFGDIPQLLQPGNQAVSAWNGAVLDLVNVRPAVTLVPTMDLFSGRQAEYLSNDHFHPNGNGYERMAQRIAQAIR